MDGELGLQVCRKYPKSDEHLQLSCPMHQLDPISRTDIDERSTDVLHMGAETATLEVNALV